MITVYHNPRCGKSRTCVAFLEEKAIRFQLIKYLDNPLNESELTSLLHKLGIKPIDLVRVKESVWIENYKGKTLSDSEIIKALVTHPILMERPVVVNGDKAVIARPLEKVTSIL